MTVQLPLANLVDAFRARLAARGEAADARLVETHISLVLLAGDFAFKFKKPVDFGFVDFSTLERRRHFCAREVELNARYAPRLYLGVETIDIDGTREYAVRMRRFPARATLAEILEHGTIESGVIANFARHLAAQHASATPQMPNAHLGSAALVRAQIEACTTAPLADLLPAKLRDALSHRLDDAMALLAARLAQGFVRDCHGDLHCANVVEFEGELQAFDCIEFTEERKSVV